MIINITAIIPATMTTMIGATIAPTLVELSLLEVSSDVMVAVIAEVPVAVTVEVPEVSEAVVIRLDVVNKTVEVGVIAVIAVVAVMDTLVYTKLMINNNT